MPTLWNELEPQRLEPDGVLDQFESYLQVEAVQHLIAEFEQQRRYPDELLNYLRELGLSNLLANQPEDPLCLESRPKNTILHGGSLMYLLGRHSGSLAITVGINFLASLPVWIAGKNDQIRDQATAIHAGEFCALAMTEIDIGSDLMQVSTTATPISGTEDFLISGTKDLINGGSQHNLLTVLARIGNSPNEGLSLFRVRRDQTVSSPNQWPTAPVPAADIASIHFSQSPAELLGRRDRGFDIVARTLTMTRGAIGALGFASASKAAELSVNYAMSRLRRGIPIIELDAIADHLLSIRTMEIIAGALSIKALTLLNRYGPAAVLPACAAKLVCTEFGEAAALEARQLHGANALTIDSPVCRLVRDAPLYGIFDGTSHIVLDLLQTRVEQMIGASDRKTDPLLPCFKSAYESTPSSLISASRLPSSTLQALPSRYLSELASHATDTDCTPFIELCSTVEQAWLQNNTVDRRTAKRLSRQSLTHTYALMESLIASIELIDPGCRKALGMKDRSTVNGMDILTQYARAWLARNICRQLANERPDLQRLDQLGRHFAKDVNALRLQILKDRRDILKACINLSG